MHSIVSRKDQLLSVFKGTYVQGWINEKCVLTEGSSLFYKRRKFTILKILLMPLTIKLNMRPTFDSSTNIQE